MDLGKVDKELLKSSIKDILKENPDLLKEVIKELLVETEGLTTPSKTERLKMLEEKISKDFDLFNDTYNALA